jgi:Family of unknown function (DUF5317)
MPGLLAPTLVAVIAAGALGGTPQGLRDGRFRAWPAAVAAFVVELALYNPPLDHQPLALQVGPWIWLASRTILLGVLLANALPRRGTVCWPLLVAAFGLALNSLVIAGNGGHMPQSAAAAAAVWGANHIDPERLQNVAPMGPDTWLAWLGDIFPEPAWLPRANVVSIGDLVLAAGIAAWVFSTLRRSNRPL